ncbi:MAG TPA: hypothetical protein DCY07_05240 [Rhodospirillaceae bacterium]|nr:hypothetical protein [Rhodospirillaceae bacterium]
MKNNLKFKLSIILPICVAVAGVATTLAVLPTLKARQERIEKDFKACAETVAARYENGSKVSVYSDHKGFIVGFKTALNKSYYNLPKRRVMSVSLEKTEALLGGIHETDYEEMALDDPNRRIMDGLCECAGQAVSRRPEGLSALLGATQANPIRL